MLLSRIATPQTVGPPPHARRVPDPLVYAHDSWGAASDTVVDLQLGLGGEEFEAVEIGPDSEADMIWLFPSPATIPPLPDNMALLPGSTIIRDPFKGAVPVSVGCPYVGPIRGPISIAPRYYNYSTGDAISGVRSGIYSAALLALFGHRLRLRLWPVCPSAFPVMRAPLDYMAQVSMLGTVPETRMLIIPAHGRRDIEMIHGPGFGVANTPLTGGTFTLRLYGMSNVPGHLSSTAGRGSLLATFALTASGTSGVFEYSGLFDHYVVTYQAAAVTTGIAATPSSRVVVRVRDRS